MNKFWRFLKHFSQERLGETPDSIYLYGYEITASCEGYICKRHVADPSKTVFVIAKIWELYR